MCKYDMLVFVVTHPITFEPLPSGTQGMTNYQRQVFCPRKITFYLTLQFWDIKTSFNNASVNSICAHAPPADPRELAFFFALDGRFPGVGTLELANPRGWGRKQRANAPSSVNSATFVINSTVQMVGRRWNWRMHKICETYTLQVK